MKQQQPKPKKVPIYRVKQVSDSLKYQEASKTTGGLYSITKKGSTAKDKQSGHDAIRSGISDAKRYNRLDSLVKKAEAKKPAMMMKKTLVKKK